MDTKSINKLNQNCNQKVTPAKDLIGLQQGLLKQLDFSKEKLLPQNNFEKMNFTKKSVKNELTSNELLASDKKPDSINSQNAEELQLNKQALNPLVFHQGFQHITEQIFENMDDQSLKNCREVANSWQNCIDNQNILWSKIAKKNGGTESFKKACKNGHLRWLRC